MKKQQVLLIHGGTPFFTNEKFLEDLKNKEIKLERLKFQLDWKTNLQNNLGENFDVFNPNFPTKDNAKYYEWVIYFEKILDKLDNEIILVGHSLGSIFLAKYLSENKINKNIKGLFLVAPPFNDEGMEEEPLGDFSLADPELKLLKEQVSNIFIYHSKDDPIVPYTHAEKFYNALPKSKLITLENRSHIFEDNLPEIVQDIRGLV